jgi:DNA polymerase-1
VEELGLVLVRARLHAAFNYAVQGSAGDQTKMAMNALFYDHGIIPNLQVHDELVDGEGTPEKAEIYKKVMEEVVTLKVPVVSEVTLGASWAG